MGRVIFQFGLLLMFISAIHCMSMCKANCPDIPIEYQELECQPEESSNKCKCPESFSCPKFSSFNKKKCYYNGQSYKPGQNLTQNLGPLCDIDCFCDRNGDIAKFTCSKTVCKEYLIKPGQPCIFQRSLDQCCATNIICGVDEIKMLPTCSYNGELFRKGEIINSVSAPGYQCICDEYFNPSIDFRDQPNCKRRTCGIQLYDLDKLEAGCVPIYEETDPTCPSDIFRCPAITDTIIQSGGGKTCHKNQPKCQFGNLKLNVGDSLNADQDPCVQCLCRNPPLVSCSRRAGC